MTTRKSLSAGGIALLLALVLAVPSAGAMEFERAQLPGPGKGEGANGRPQTRIVGGGPADISQFPWQAQIRANLPGGEEFVLCGGSVIHPLIVLSAAHCFLDEFGELEEFESVEVWLGRTAFDSGGELRFAKNLWKPADYNPEANFPRSNSFDYAFLSLFDPTAQPRILVAGPTERALWTPGRVGTVTGWGVTSEGGAVSPVLKQAQIPFLSDQVCTQTYGVEFDLPTMVCAGELAGGTDSCQGDSGGPLASPIDGGGFRLTGIVSWGEGCARPGTPGVYTRIAGGLVGSVGATVATIEEKEEFPPQFSGIQVIGSGARPPGCAAAEAGPEGTRSAVAAADALITQRDGEARRAAAVLRKAKQAARKVRRAARKSHAATRRVKKAARLVRRASRAARLANQRLADAQAEAVRAGEALTAATASRNAICG